MVTQLTLYSLFVRQNCLTARRSADECHLIAGSDEPGEAHNRPNPITGPASSAAAYQEFIAAAAAKGLSAQRIWQDLVELHAYACGLWGAKVNRVRLFWRDVNSGPE